MLTFTSFTRIHLTWCKLRLILYFLDQRESLRLAVVEYLERQHKDDTEESSRAALRFGMFRKVAVMLEEAARALLKKLQPSQLGQSQSESTPSFILLMSLIIAIVFPFFISENDLNTQTSLQTIVNYFSDAAENYAKVRI